jgi:exodeoxyribonuclease X
MLIRVIDFETTGLPPNAAVCEAGWTDLIVEGNECEIRPTMARLIHPGRAIPEEVSKIHGITDAMVVGCPSPDAVFREMMEDADVFCAHNCEFEQNFFRGGDRAWLCTYKVALVHLSDAPSHKNGALPEYLGLQLDPALCEPAHRAGPDTYTTAHVLAALIGRGHDVAEMIEITKKPRQISRMPFGKHKGTYMVDLPDGYLRWGIENMDARDVVAAMKREVARRKAA